MTMIADDPVFCSAPSLRRRLRHCLESVLQASGAGGMYVRMYQVRGAVVLMYHSIAGPASAEWIDPRNRITPEVFARQMGMLARSRRVISMTQLAEAIHQGETQPAGTVAITFDDGYLDNLAIAAPILTELKLPATLYLPTGYVERGEPQWIDRLYSAFRMRTRPLLTINDVTGSPFNLRELDDRQTAYRRIAEHLLMAGADTRRAALEEVENQLHPADLLPRLTMIWDDVRRLVAEYPSFEIGVHTREHIDLTSCSAATMEAEIRSCIEDVERETGVRPAHFSFPYSRWNAGAAQLLRDLGLRSAVGSSDDCLLRKGVDPFRLPRIEAPASMSRFLFVTSGAYPALPRLLLSVGRGRQSPSAANGRANGVPASEVGR